MKRAFDFVMAFAALVALAPAFAAIALAVWLEDRHAPWYRGVRVARGGGEFRMVKFRSMRPDAWKTGVNSTSAGDWRITRVGRFLRRTKLDELPQLWNVLTGDMSLVGPRPQVRVDVSLYTAEESRMLAVRPGITDLASIVFADEGEILRGSADPDLLYNQVIRPWKSRLAILYVDRRSFGLDLKILLWTLGTLFSRHWALKCVGELLDTWDVGGSLRETVRRRGPLLAYPPPGSQEIVSRYLSTTA